MGEELTIDYATQTTHPERHPARSNNLRLAALARDLVNGTVDLAVLGPPAERFERGR